MNQRLLTLAALLLLAPAISQAQLATLTVTVRGLVPATGAVEVSVFNSPETFMKEPSVQQSAKVDGKEELEFRFSGMLEGKYAVVVVHDENDNGALDTGFLGFGGESFGYSNDAFSWFGRPGFDAASFSIGTEDADIVITLD